MEGNSISKTTLARPPSMGLRSRIVVAMATIVVGIVLITSIYFSVRSASQLHEASQERVKLMREDLQQKGLVLARNVALSSQTAIAFKNYSFLQDIIGNILKNDSSIQYGIIMSQQRLALVHSDPSKAGTQLSAEHDLRAADTGTSEAFEVSLDGKDYLEVDSDIAIGGKHWGKVRFGLSLQQLNAEIARSAAATRTTIWSNLGLAAVVTLLLISLGTWAGVIFSRGLTGPLDRLLVGVRSLQRGDMDAKLDAQGGIPEFVVLSDAFNEMTQAVKTRQTELEEALRKVEEAYRLKSQFLSNVSHELRTPLNAIINVPSILLKDYPEKVLYTCEACQQQFAPELEADELPESLPTSVECPSCQAGQAHRSSTLTFRGEPQEHIAYLNMGLRSARHLMAVVDDLLDASKLEAGRMELFTSHFHIRNLFDEVGQTAVALTTPKKVSLHLPVFDQEHDVEHDYVKVSQMLLNLISNAVKFTPEGGHIYCSVEGLESTAPDATLRYSVRDTGEGMAEDKQTKLFQNFYQVDGGHTRKHGGTGLGLAITRQLAILHGGNVSVRSALGEGSTFTIEIPRFCKPVKPTFGDDMPTGSGKIVVVDDDATQLNLVFKVLTKAGYEVVTIKSPREGVEIIEQVQPDLVMFDVMMPDISGVSLLRTVRSDPRFKHMPAIISTGFPDQREIVQALGAVFLPKPWGVNELATVVKQTLESGKQIVGRVNTHDNEPVLSTTGTQSGAVDEAKGR